MTNCTICRKSINGTQIYGTLRQPLCWDCWWDVLWAADDDSKGRMGVKTKVKDLKKIKQEISILESEIEILQGEIEEMQEQISDLEEEEQEIERLPEISNPDDKLEIGIAILLKDKNDGISPDCRV